MEDKKVKHKVYNNIQAPPRRFHVWGVEPGGKKLWLSSFDTQGEAEDYVDTEFGSHISEHGQGKIEIEDMVEKKITATYPVF